MAKKSAKRLSAGRLIVMVIVIAACMVMARNIEREDASTPMGSQVYGDLLDTHTAPGTPEVKKRYKGMDLSFNPRAHIPNWVAWELTDEETRGKAPRTNKFAADETVEGCAETWDYAYSGYDRGHMAPAGDMKWDSEAMAQTFLLTNICPQSKALNTGAWRTLEEKCRVWARKMGKLYIVCGPVIDGKPIEYIGDSKVYVPGKFFKAIIAPDQRMGIGFIMPNAKVKGGMQPCAVTIDSIESLTGHDLFPSLPDDLETDIESQCNFNRWVTVKPDKNN
ncbi:MAG: DNA/RNA non-specific endonuclease [Muribaculaceae bacterium]|nr:DNA/RNA non-specific endonuclease [Muribaculaceae bacterium]